MITYIDLEHAYNGQEAEDPSFDSKGNLWFMDCKRNLFRTDFNADEYGLNKNKKSINNNNGFRLLKNIPLGIGYIINTAVETAQDLTAQLLGDEEIEIPEEILNITGQQEQGGKSGIDGIQGQVYDYLLDKGVPAVGAAAILGNMHSETDSSWDPAIVNYIGASGLCQWLGTRLENLKKLAASRGKDWTDVECQLDYMWQELNTDYYKHVKDVIMESDQESELEYATWYWGRHFEVFFNESNSFEESKNMTENRYKHAQHWYQEWQKHHTSKKDNEVTNSSNGNSENNGNTNNLSINDESQLVEETLKYACSWVGKVPYKSTASGNKDNNERFLPLQEGRASDCSHFIHWVFAQVGLMEGTQEYFNAHGHSEQWGKGGDAGGCPGTVKIGTDLSKASPGDVLWWDMGSESWEKHVAIYLGNNKMVECAWTGDEKTSGVKITPVTQNDGIDQILHFDGKIPTDPTGYYDPYTMTYHSSLKKSSTENPFQGLLNADQSNSSQENNENSDFEQFKKDFLSENTLAIFDSEGTRKEWLDAINAKGINGEKGGTILYAKDGSKPKDWYERFKNDEDFLKGKKYILVEVGPNDLNDWNSMENLLDLLMERKDNGAKIFFEQIETTSGGSRSAIDAFNQHLKEYENTHKDCYYIKTREYPNDLTDGNGKVIHCDARGLHFQQGLNIKDGKGAYELWAENTVYAVYEVLKRENELGFMGITSSGNGIIDKGKKALDNIMDSLTGNDPDQDSER